MKETKSTANKWPEIRTVRKLQVPLTDDDVRNLGRENAHLGAEIEALGAAKKASAQNFTAQITERSTRRSVNDTAISNGWSEKDIDCLWVYEQNKKREADPRRKILVRTDTDTVVEEALISDDERQTQMHLSGVDDEPKHETTLVDAAPVEEKKPARVRKAKQVAEAANAEAEKVETQAEAAAMNS